VEGPELEQLQGLHDDVYHRALEWYEGMSGPIRERINAQYGALPDKEVNIQVRGCFHGPRTTSQSCLEMVHTFNIGLE